MNIMTLMAAQRLKTTNVCKTYSMFRLVTDDKINNIDEQRKDACSTFNYIQPYNIHTGKY